MKHGHAAVVLASGLPLLKKNSFTRHLLTIARALKIRSCKSDIAGRDPEVSGKQRVEKQIEQLQFVIQSRSRQAQQLTLTIQRDLLIPKLNRLPLIFNTQVQIFFQPVKFNLGAGLSAYTTPPEASQHPTEPSHAGKQRVCRSTRLVPRCRYHECRIRLPREDRFSSGGYLSDW